MITGIKRNLKTMMEMERSLDQDQSKKIFNKIMINLSYDLDIYNVLKK